MFDDWPGVAARIVTRLRRMGAERMNAEDLASEAVMRAWTKQVEFESPEHLFNWTMLVARNLYIDQRRADARGPEVCVLDDLEVPTHDTAVVAEHRMQLRRVLDALGRMSHDDRLAVMTDATPADRKDAVRLNVRRHRARARLRAALAGIAGLLGLRRLPKAGLAATPVAFAALVTIGLPFATHAPRGDRPAATVPMPAQSVVLEGDERPALRGAAPAAVAAALAPAFARPVAAAPPGRAPRPPEGHSVTIGDGKTKVQPYVRPTRPNDHLVCVSNESAGGVCAGRPLGETPLDPLLKRIGL